MTDFRKRQKSIEFMKHPDLWPRWPILPVVIRGSDPKSGVMIELNKRVEPIVYEGYMFDMANINDMPPIEYDSFEALVDAGWEVD